MLLSCESGKTSFYYPNKQSFLELKNKDTLYLDQFTTFEQIIDSLWYYNSNEEDKNPIFLIEENNIQYFLKPVALSVGFKPPTEKIRNQIGISKDSIIKNETVYSIDSLNIILIKDLLNYGKNNNLAESPQKLIISFFKPDNESIPNLKNSLLKLFKTYNLINNKDTLELNIRMDRFFIPEPLPTRNE